MSYLQKEKSSFGTIFMALSVVAAIGFGLMYFMFGKSVANEGEDASNPAPAPAAVQTMTKSAISHTHV